MNPAKTPNDGVTNVDQTILPTTVRLERLRVMVLLWIGIAIAKTLQLVESTPSSSGKRWRKTLKSRAKTPSKTPVDNAVEGGMNWKVVSEKAPEEYDF